MDSPIPPDPYVALGVTKESDASAIKKAYHKLALKLHPDKCTDESQKAARTDEFTKIQQAWDILGDSEKKSRYDAMVKLAELRRQNMEMRGSAGPRDYNVRMAAPRDAPREGPYSTRMPQSRTYEQPPPRPRYYEDDYEPARGSSRKTNLADDFVFVKKSPPREEKREKTKASAVPREEERRRDQKRRDAEIRESRTTKSRDMRDDYDDRRRRDYDRRQGDASDSFGSSTEKIFEDKLREAQKIIDRDNNRQPRPNPIRRESSRQVPNLYRESSDPRRSAAASKEKERRRTSPSKDDRRRENQDPYERDRRVPLNSYSSAPPVVESTIPPPPHRSYTTPGEYDSKKKTAKDPSPPPFPRSTTQPLETMAGAPSSSKRKETRARAAQEDSGYSSPGYPAAYAYGDEHAAPPGVSYSNGRRTVYREPSSTNRRSDPSPARPSKGAVKMKGLDPNPKSSSSSSKRTAYAYTPEAGVTPIPIVEPKSSSSRRDRVSERDRDRDYDYVSYDRSRPLHFGEHGAGTIDPRYGHPSPQYEHGYTRAAPAEVRYTTGRGRDFERPSMQRNATSVY